MKKVRKMLRSQKGMTLIELLAVVVILAILALIAIPSIGGLIENSKKDNMLADAQQMISSARLVIATDTEIIDNDTQITLKKLVDNGYMENVNDPFDKGGASDTDGSYNQTGSFVTVKKDATSGKYSIENVTLIGDGKKITAVAPKALKRSAVK